jgi:hypothetical protein
VKARRVLIAFLVCLGACASLSARKPPTLAAKQAKGHVGETAKVCGQVASMHFAFKTRGQPTFLNFDKPYPHQPFAAVIWGLDRGKFGDPQQHYLNKHICVTGPIRTFHGQPEIVLHSPSQVTGKQAGETSE